MSAPRSDGGGGREKAEDAAVVLRRSSSGAPCSNTSAARRAEDDRAQKPATVTLRARPKPPGAPIFSASKHGGDERAEQRRRRPRPAAPGGGDHNALRAIATMRALPSAMTRRSSHVSRGNAVASTASATHPVCPPNVWPFCRGGTTFRRKHQQPTTAAGRRACYLHVSRPANQHPTLASPAVGSNGGLGGEIMRREV